MRTKFFIFAFLWVFFNSCSQDKCENMCISSSFIFLNTNGQDIFDSLSTPHINIEDFIIKNYKGQAYNFQRYIINDTSNFEIGFWMNGNSASYTYFIFDEQHTDTIIAYFGEKKCSTFISKLYYSGTLIENHNHCPGAETHRIVVPILK